MLYWHTAIAVQASCTGAFRRIRESIMFVDLILKAYVQTQLFFRRSDGASAIEYVIIVAIVALVIVGVGSGLGEKIKGVFTSVSNALPAATGS